jgi:uncharacterized pyridoxamine 5'-phosphate oxidase family protein
MSPMHESLEDLAELQVVLDESYASGGSHLRSIFTEDRRIAAAELSGLLVGVRVLNLATVTAAGEPRVAPVDGHFHRGRFYFGSSPDSVRFRHLRARPAVSAAYTLGEEMAVIVHGNAVEIDVRAPEHDAFREQLIETYGRDPTFVDYLQRELGGEWHRWFEGAAYARIDPRAMFTFRSGR